MIEMDAIKKMKSRAAGSSTAPPKFSIHEDVVVDDAEDNGDDQYATTNLSDGF